MAVVAMAAGCALGFAPSASAVTVDGSGWWWRPNTATAPVDVPPRADVTPDQLLAEGTAEGSTAVAAVRFTLSEGEGSPILTITPTQDSVLPPDAVVLACRVASAWEPVQGGKWERRPVPDCFTSVQGIPGDGGTLVFALTPLQSDRDLEVLITPGNNPAAPNDNARGSVFTLKFPKPTAADLKTSSDEAGGFSGVGGDFSSPDPSSFGADSETDNSGTGSSFDTGSSIDSGSSFDSGATTFDGGGATSFGPSPAFSQPSTFTAPTAVAPAASASVPAAEQAGPTGVAPPLQAAPVSNDAGSSSGRTLGILVLIAGAALAFWAYSSSMTAAVAPVVPVAPPPGTEPVIGGLGRFARPRLGPPPSLS